MVENQASSALGHQSELKHSQKSDSVANDDTDVIIDNPVVEVSRDIFRLEADIKTLSIRVDKRLMTKNIQISIGHFRKNYDAYFQAFKSTPVDEKTVLSAGRHVATYGESVGHVLNRFSSLGFENRRLAQQIIQLARSINNTLATQKDLYLTGLKNYNQAEMPEIEDRAPVEPVPEQGQKTEDDEVHAFDALAKNLANAESLKEIDSSRKQEKYTSDSQSTSGILEQAVEKASGSSFKASVTPENKALMEQLEKRKRQFQALATRAKKSEAEQKQKYEALQQEHANALHQIELTRKVVQDLDDSRAVEAEDAILERYEVAAEEERDSASFYRYSAFGYLAVFFSLASYLFIGISFAGFEWVKTTLRAGIALTLLVPFAYTAIEARMHRRQQHDYAKKALELKGLLLHRAKIAASPSTDVNALELDKSNADQKTTVTDLDELIEEFE